MKKVIFLSLLLLGCIGLTGCNSCKSDNGKQEEVLAELVVENTVSADREWMFENYGSDYSWYETCVLLKDYLDEECDGTVEGVSNVFQSLIEKEKGFDSQAIVSAYAAGKHTTDVRAGLWVGDFPLNDEEIKITFKEAFERIMEANFPKPHSRQCVLRREVGSKPNVAPQYIFGNVQAQLYVDAVTGEVTDENPAYIE